MHPLSPVCGEIERFFGSKSSGGRVGLSFSVFVDVLVTAVGTGKSSNIIDGDVVGRFLDISFSRYRFRGGDGIVLAVSG